MKKFFMALTVALILMSGSFSEAADITREQFDKVVTDVKKTDYPAPLNIDAETFVTRFNWFIIPIVQDGLDKDDISDIEHLFVIDNLETIPTDNGTIYANTFGYRGAMTLMASSGDDQHDPLNSVIFCYTTPTAKGESVFTVWFLKAFIGSFSTEIDVQNLMNELTAEGSTGSVVKAGVRFSLKEDGDLNILTVTPK